MVYLYREVAVSEMARAWRISEEMQRRNKRNEEVAVRIDQNVEIQQQVHTFVKCAVSGCERGVRHSYAVGGMCVPCAEAELTRLRGIEAACTLEQTEVEEAARVWRNLADWFATRGPSGWETACRAIADALTKEAKP